MNIKRVISNTMNLWTVFRQNNPRIQQIGRQDLHTFITQTHKIIQSHSLTPLLFEDKDVWVMLKNGLAIRYINKMNSALPDLVLNGEYEKGTTRFVLNNLEEGVTFFDIGANLGWYSLMAAHTFRRITVHAFDPVKDTIEDLTANIVRNGYQNKIIINEAAVSSQNNTVYVTTNHYASNYVTDKNYPNTYPVKCITLDSYIKDNKIQRVDFMKCDVEGLELSVFKGALETINKFKPTILVEIIDKPTMSFENRKEESSKDTISLLLSLGYKYYVIDDKEKYVPMGKINKAIMKRSFHNYIFYVKPINLR